MVKKNNFNYILIYINVNPQNAIFYKNIFLSNHI